jgi:DNA-binding MarR family transcriptional regulator
MSSKYRRSPERAIAPEPSQLKDRAFESHAHRTFASRARRLRFFSVGMFGEPAWDMLLVLYATEQASLRHTVSSLVHLALVPSTTVLRWLDYLEREGLVARRSNSADWRDYYLEITDKAREALDAYFSETLRKHT